MKPAPILLLGAPFSGVGRLAARLAAHPELCVIPETALFYADDIGALLEIFELSQNASSDGLLRAVAELEFGAQTDANIITARDWLAARSDWSTAAMFAHLVARAAPRRLLMPDTDSVLRVSDLLRVQRAAPDAQIVHCVRHPWTQGARFAHWLDAQLFVAPDFRDFSAMPAPIEPQIAWLRINQTLETRLRPAYAARWQRLRAEDVEDEARTADVLDALCAALQLAPWSEAASDQSFAVLGPREAPYGFDAELLDATADEDCDQPRLDQPLPWRRESRVLADEVVQLAREYGYS